YSGSGHAEAKAEGQSFRETHFSFFQDGFDESGGVGIGYSRGSGRGGGGGGGASGRTRTSGTQVAFRTCRGNLCDFAAAAEIGSGASSVVDYDGGTFGSFRSAGSDGTASGPEVAKRFAHSRKKGWRHSDGNACRAESSALCDCGNRAERESGKISRRAC